MTTPVDVVNVMWVSLPFIFISLLVNLRELILHWSFHRIILAFSCALAFIANGSAILMFGPWQGMNLSVNFQVGITAFNLSHWMARLYVCNRMAKLCPSPTISTAFDRLAYVTVSLFSMTMVTYISTVRDFYDTHPAEQIAVIEGAAVSCGLAANIVFEVTSLYLHIKSLISFGRLNSTGIKLLILSCSTLASLLFDALLTAAQLAGDVFLQLSMAGITVAILPCSLILGETIVKLIGKITGKKSLVPHSSEGNSSTRSKDRVNLDEKGTSSTILLRPTTAKDMNEPIRQSPTLSRNKTKPVVVMHKGEPIRQSPTSPHDNAKPVSSAEKE